MQFVRMVGWIERIAYDVRHAARGLRSDWRFALFAISTIAVGIGLTASVLSIADGILFRRLPYANADRLVVPLEAGVGSVSPGGVDAFRTLSIFDAIADWQPDFSDTVAEADEVIRFSAVSVAERFFETLGVEAALGRLFTSDDFHTADERSVLLMNSFWQRLGGDPSIVGRSFHLDERTVRVVGVLPPSFVFPSRLPQPTALTPRVDSTPLATPTVVLPIARLRNGVSVAQANSAFAAAIRAPLPRGEVVRSTWGVQRLRDAMFSTTRRVLITLLVAVTSVLLIVCANLTNLLLARGSERMREFAVRTALGATRGRLVQQLATESVLLALIGGILGVGLSFAAFDLAYDLIPGSLYRLLSSGIDIRVITLVMTASLAAGIVFGVVPAVRLSGGSRVLSLHFSGSLRTTASVGSIGSIVVAVETALVFVLLATAGLMIRSFANLQSVDVGISPDGVDVVSLNLPRSKYSGSDLSAFSQDLVARILRIPGVDSAAGVYNPPGSLAAGWSAANLPNAPPRTAHTWPVTHRHFETFGIIVRAGRTFTEAEVATNAPVAVLTERAARIGWPAGDALGQYVSIPNESPRQIVGIVGDIRASKQVPGPATVYIPLHPTLLRMSDIAVRLRGNREALRAQLIAVAKSEDSRSRPIIRSYEDIFEPQIAVPRFQTLLFSAFGMVGLVVAVCGILGVVQYVVSRRTREIGIRIALGAQAHQVRVMVLRQALAPVTVGLTVGLLVASGVTRALDPWLFEISPGDPMTLAAASFLMIVAAAVAAYLPARQVARLNPIDAIRVE